MEKTYKRLQDLTGHEAGIIEYESGETLICNWSHDDGIPRMFATGLIGFGEEFTAKRIAMPNHLKKLMQQHDKENGCKQYVNGYRAWKVTCGEETLIVATQEMWH